MYLIPELAGSGEQRMVLAARADDVVGVPSVAELLVDFFAINGTWELARVVERRLHDHPLLILLIVEPLPLSIGL